VPYVYRWSQRLRAWASTADPGSARARARVFGVAGPGCAREGLAPRAKLCAVHARVFSALQSQGVPGEARCLHGAAVCLHELSHREPSYRELPHRELSHPETANFPSQTLPSQTLPPRDRELSQRELSHPETANSPSANSAGSTPGPLFCSLDPTGRLGKSRHFAPAAWIYLIRKQIRALYAAMKSCSSGLTPITLILYPRRLLHQILADFFLLKSLAVHAECQAVLFGLRLSIY